MLSMERYILWLWRIYWLCYKQIEWHIDFFVASCQIFQPVYSFTIFICMFSSRNPAFWQLSVVLETKNTLLPKKVTILKMINSKSVKKGINFKTKTINANFIRELNKKRLKVRTLKRWNQLKSCFDLQQTAIKKWD